MKTPDEDTTKTFTSPKGIVLKLRPVSQFKLDSFRTSQEEVPIPTYKMNVVGEEVEYPLDETIAKNKGRLDEWNEYLKKKAEANKIYSQRFSELLVWEGVDIEVPDENSDWQKSCDAFGIKIPPVSEPIKRKMQYVYSEILVSPEDVAALVSQILTVSQMDEKAVAKIRESFRAKKERNPDKGPDEKKGKVADKQPNV